jgi:hypothetical protein
MGNNTKHTDEQDVLTNILAEGLTTRKPNAKPVPIISRCG